MDRLYHVDATKGPGHLHSLINHSTNRNNAILYTVWRFETFPL